MPATEPIQAGPYPEPSDPPDGPNQMSALAMWAAGRLVMRFASTAARDAAITSPVAGMVAVTGSGESQVVWIYTGTVWEILWAPDDTGWVNVPVASGWTVNTPVQVRRIGAVVYWRGRVTPDASVSGAQTIVAAGGVPSWARPASVFHAMRACPSSHTSSVAESRVKVAAVQPDGALVAWYGTSNADQITLSGLSGYAVE